MSVIKSYYFSDQEIIESIRELYLDGFPIHVDPTYSVGSIYKNSVEPILKYDLVPKQKEVKKANVTNLPIDNNFVSSILYDPPFMWGIRNSEVPDNNNKFAKRYTMFKTFYDLKQQYNLALMEFYRILKNKGILIFKCQDFTDDKTTMTHCLVYNWATEKGFYCKDIFLKLVRSRIYNSRLKQRHSRKFHSYYYVFEKCINMRWSGR